MRFPKALFIATPLVAVPLLALALLRTSLSDSPEVNLTRLLEGDRPRAAEGWDAEFQIQGPPESRIWLEESQIGVEVLGVRGDWTRMAAKGKSPAPSSSGLSQGRTISRKFWLGLPARVKSCRFTIGFRRETLNERGMRALRKSGVARRFPAISGWILEHLPHTERWLECRREVRVAASSIKIEAHNESLHSTPR